MDEAMDDKTLDALRRTMLFDFYGDLLTEKQREYYHLHYNEDLSLGEIAQLYGISRQAVYDIIHRAEVLMVSFEEKTGFLDKTVKRLQILEQMAQDIQALPDCAQAKALLSSFQALRELDR